MRASHMVSRRRDGERCRAEPSQSRDIDPLRCRVANVAKPVRSYRRAGRPAVRLLTRSLARSDCVALVCPSVHTRSSIRRFVRGKIASPRLSLLVAHRRRRRRHISKLYQFLSFSLSLSSYACRGKPSSWQSRRRDKDDDDEGRKATTATIIIGY